jgi:hypothetical protein
MFKLSFSVIDSRSLTSITAGCSRFSSFLHIILTHANKKEDTSKLKVRQVDKEERETPTQKQRRGERDL